jgi:hypothetical protein
MAESALEFLQKEYARLQREGDVAQQEREAQKSLMEKQIKRLIARDGGHATVPPSAPAKPVPAPDGNHKGRAYTIYSFQGMSKPTALELYMRARKDDGKISFGEIVRDLLDGGLQALEEGNTDFRERSIMAIVRQQPQLYGYDRDRHLAWLAPTANNKPLPEARGRKKDSRGKH